MERRANRFGTLVSKGEGKPWLAKWVCEGKVYYKSTGQVDRKKALKVLEQLTRPYREKSKDDIIENLELQLKRLKERCGVEKKLAIKDIWSEFAKTLWQSNVEQGTMNTYEKYITHLQGWMNGKALDASGIDNKLAELYLKHLAECVGDSSFNLRLSMFRRVWKALAAEYKIDATLWDSFKKRTAPKSIRHPFSVNELGKLVANAMNDDIKALVLIGAYTGLRVSDCAMLKWSEVDFEHATINVIPQKTKKHITEPLVIPMHNVLKEMLMSMKHDGEYVSESNAAGYKSGQLRRDIAELFKKCGIETSCKVNGKTKIVSGFHALRHTFVSMAVNNGMSPLLVQRIVGHSTVSMTDHYFHENIDKMAEGVSALPDIVKIA